MKKVLILFFGVLNSLIIWSQSDNCVTATPITITSAPTCVNGTTAGGTADLVTTSCNASPSVNFVWYQFTCTGTQNTITLTPGTLQNAVMVVDGTACGDATIDFCNTATGSNPITILNSQTVGTTVLVSIGSLTGNEGTFQLCITSTTPTSFTGGDLCSNAIPFCNAAATANIPSMASYTGVGAGGKPSCFTGPGSNPTQDMFFTFTVYQAGTIAWTGNPNSNSTEFDWALYNVTSGCPGTLLCCNYNYGGSVGANFGQATGGAGPCGTSALGGAAGEFSPTTPGVAGQTYAIFISNWSGDGTGFVFNFTGTAAIAPVANFTINPNTVTCGPSVNVTINNSSTAPGNWTYGDGTTATNTSSPPSHIYNTPGTYPITLTIPGACPSTQTQFVQLYGPLAGTISNTPASCPNTTNGSASVSSVSGGDGIYTYLWNTGATTPSISGLAPGNYSVTISNAACGSNIVLNTTVAAANPLPTVPSVSGGGTFCSGQPITPVTANVTGTANWTVNYTLNGTPTSANGSSSPVSLGTTAGNYVITGVSDNFCTNTASGNASIVINPLPTASISGGGTYCAGAAPGNISVSATGTGPWTVNYTLNGTPQTANFASSPFSLGNAAGTYVLTGVTDALCSNSASGSQTITVNPLPVISLTPTDPTTCNGTNGTILVSGSGTGTIYWSGTASSNGAGALNYTITNLSAGPYSVYFVDGTTGCQSATSNTSLNNPNAPILNNPGPSTVCDTYTLPAISGTNLTAAASYWTGANGTGTQLSVGNPITTTQTVYLYDINGSCSDEESFLVTVNNTPAITNPGAQTVCDSYTLGAIGGTNLSGSQAYYNNSQAMGGSVIAGPITSTQTVWIYDAEGSCSDEESFVVNVDITPTLTNPGPQTVCDSYSLSVITGTNLSGNENYYNNSQAMGGSVISGPITSSQTVWIYGNDGACSDEESFVVTVNITPTFTLTGTDPTVCNGTDGTITISGLNASTNYDVTYDDDAVGTGTLSLSSNASGNIVISGLNAGTYDNFTVTLNGCTGTSATVITLINPNAPVLNNPGPSTVCDSYTLPSITGTNLTSGVSYWTQTGGTGSQLTAGGNITSTQTVYIYDINGSCSDEVSFTVTVDYTPTLNNPGNQTQCVSFTLPAITGTTLSGSESYWTSPGGTGTQLSVGGNVTSSQTVYVYDADGACSDEVSFVVTINPLPTVTSTSGTNTYCIGDASQNVEVNVTGSASWTIDYTLDGVAMSATGNASPVVLGNAAGEYILMGITDANCTNSATGTETITFVGCDYTIPTAFTPNADGVHDDWELYGLDAAYPNNVVRIYNRWGGLLYEHDSSVDGPYDSNRWKGDYNGEALPVGSYYYIIELNDEDKKVESGAVSILLEK